MHSDLIGKIEKARRYAQEPERVQISEFKANVHGDNGTSHTVELKNDEWHCTCSFFRLWGTCAHIMAAQKILNPMLTVKAREPHIAINFQEETVKEETILA